jgi:hypothetical protein
MSSNGNRPEDSDFIDPKGYWADPQRNIRRMSGEQEVVLQATQACTKGEWIYVLDSLELQGPVE